MFITRVLLFLVTSLKLSRPFTTVIPIWAFYEELVHKINTSGTISAAVFQRKKDIKLESVF